MRLLIALLVLLSWSAHAAYPEKPIRFILPSAAGGSVDVLMRVLAEWAEVVKKSGAKVD